MIFSDDEPAFQTLPAPLQLHLVDHNSSHSLPHPVASIIDHHADEGQHLSASPRIITPSGSCSSLIINELFNPAQLAEEERVQIATLALAAVLIDTAGMSHKVTAHDEAAVEMLEACCEVGYERAGFFGALFAAKTDVEGMETRDLLRKDWKEWEEGGLRVGVASVVKGLGWLDGRGDLLDTVKSWGTERKCDVVAVMTTDGKGEGFKRELLLWALKEEGRNCVKCFWEQAGDEGMKLESLGGGELDGEHRKAWTQGNLAMSRKQVAPLLRECLKKSFDTKL